MQLKITKKPRKIGAYGGGKGIRTLVGGCPNGFQDRLVMTTSISLRIWNCFRRNHRIIKFFRNIFRNAVFGCFRSARKVSVYKVFLRFCDRSARKFSRPPRYVLLRCTKFLFALAHKISTAATPYASLHHPPGALGNVPTSISLRIWTAIRQISSDIQFF